MFFHVELNYTLLWMWDMGDPNYMIENNDLENFIDAIT